MISRIQLSSNQHSDVVGSVLLSVNSDGGVHVFQAQSYIGAQFLESEDYEEAVPLLESAAKSKVLLKIILENKYFLIILMA